MKSPLETTWFTSDTHFNHQNIIKYCNRPFENVQEMNDTLLFNINSCVGLSDTLYHLGDFVYAKGNVKEQIRKFRDRILCRHVFLIIGNHDPHDALWQPKRWLWDIFSGVYVQARLKIEQCPEIVLNHCAMRVWDKSHHGAFQLFGHSHGTLTQDNRLRSHDVGVDVNEYKPINLQQVIDIMSQKEWQPIDHHRDRS